MKLLEVNNLNKSFNGLKALNDFSCSIVENEIVGLIGPNGAGKSTLFNVITSFLQQDSGSVYFCEKQIDAKPSHKIVNLGVSRTFQDLRLIRQIRVIDNLLLSFPAQKGLKIYEIFFQGSAIKKNEKANYLKALELLEYANLLEKENELAGNLSYGQQKLLSILCSLAAKPKLLLLDEPIAGVNPEMRDKILKIISEIPSEGKSVMLIDHDMEFIKNICNKIIFMDAGRKISEGKPEDVLNDPRVIEAYLK